MEELDDGIGQALPVVHLETSEVTLLAQDLWEQHKVLGEEPEMEEGLGHSGWCHPSEVVLGCISEAAQQAQGGKA